MIRMGLKPYATDDDGIDKMLKTTKYPPSQFLPAHLTLLMLPVLDRSSDVRNRVEAYYKSQGWDETLAEAVEMHALIEARNPKIAGTIKETYQKCWGMLFPLV
jgi:hypothetical protein